MSIEKFFTPESIAVVGASKKPGKVGNTVLKNLKEHFKGEIIPINPKHDEIMGLNCFNSVKELEKVPDNVVVAVPAKIANKVMKQCCEIGVPTVTMLTSGYEEIGERGEEMQKELESILESSDTRMVGPNCLGIYDSYSGIDSMFLPGYKIDEPEKGGISIISQSGAVGSAVIDKAAHEGVGVSKFVSYGNQLDVSETDLLKFLKNDGKTDGVAVYMEGVKNGEKFLEEAVKVCKEKPVVVLKAGKSKKGSKAAESHTGSLAGDYEVYKGAFRKTGVVEAENNEQLIDYVKTLGKCGEPKGNKVAVITNGGGFGVLSTDSIEESELELAKFSEETEERLNKIIKDYGNVSNPMDLIGDASPEDYSKAMKIVAEADEVDMILCISLIQTEQMSSKFIDVVEEVKQGFDKPVVCSLLGGSYTELHKKYIEKNGVPTFDYPENAVKSLEKLFTYHRWRKRRT